MAPLHCFTTKIPERDKVHFTSYLDQSVSPCFFCVQNCFHSLSIYLVPRSSTPFLPTSYYLRPIEVSASSMHWKHSEVGRLRIFLRLINLRTLQVHSNGCASLCCVTWWKNMQSVNSQVYIDWAMTSLRNLKTAC